MNKIASLSNFSTTSSHTTSSKRSRERKQNSFRVVIKTRPYFLNDAYDQLSVEKIDNKTVNIDNGSIARKYKFDLVADSNIGQEDFFNSCGIISLINAAFLGYSVAILAYGQTGSGKTYTMSGPIDSMGLNIPSICVSSGLMQRASKYICNLALERGFSIEAGYLEIYNERAYDLLNLSSTDLEVRGDITNGFYVEQQLFVECTSMEDLMAVVTEGNNNRHISSHELNIDSSRSHCVLTVKITGNVKGYMKEGSVIFVDLAGSERLKDSKNFGEISIKETANINKSLFVLGKVISKLSHQSYNSNHLKDHHVHIPYRDSLLTKLLCRSLCGDALVLMISTIRPEIRFVDETLSTLNYSTKAMNIITKPKCTQSISRENVLRRLQDENNKLRVENTELKQLIKQKTISYNNLSRSSSMLKQQSIESISYENGDVKKLKRENENLKQKVLSLEKIFISTTHTDETYEDEFHGSFFQ